ncbi:MAG: hypothetical protein HS111_08545 [Kofleriaceae bacterium]|nr:hypothetical protein [Kofleriaceae bacterium]MCL4223799.1 hypothetical protein [Myxococcales bacterium]
MPRKVPAPPPPELLDRIRGEIAASGFLRDLTTWADRQCGKLLSIENRIEPHKATELVNAAVVDTCDGVRRWDPAARTLRRHLEQTINSRLWHECERSRRRRFIVLDTASVDDSQDATGGAAIHVEVSELREDPRTRPDGQLAQREVRARVFEVLRQRAARDAELLALVDAYEAGHSRQADAEARVGLSGQAFQNLVRRFKTIRGHIPDDLREAAQEALVRDGGAPLAGRAGRGASVGALVAPGDEDDADESTNDSR